MTGCRARSGRFRGSGRTPGGMSTLFHVEQSQRISRRQASASTEATASPGGHIHAVPRGTRTSGVQARGCPLPRSSPPHQAGTSAPFHVKQEHVATRQRVGRSCGRAPGPQASASTPFHVERASRLPGNESALLSKHPHHQASAPAPFHVEQEQLVTRQRVGRSCRGGRTTGGVYPPPRSTWNNGSPLRAEESALSAEAPHPQTSVRPVPRGTTVAGYRSMGWPLLPKNPNHMDERLRPVPRGTRSSK